MEHQWLARNPLILALALPALACPELRGQMGRRSPEPGSAPVRARRGPASSARPEQMDHRSPAEALLAPELCALAAGQWGYQQRDQPLAVAEDCFAAEAAARARAALRQAADERAARLRRALQTDRKPAAQARRERRLRAGSAPPHEPGRSLEPEVQPAP